MMGHLKTGLVLEGGAMRGMFTAGVLDVFMEHGVHFDGVIGVSAGAVFGPNFLSGQIGRVIRYNKRYNGDHDYMGLKPLLSTGNIVNTKYAYGTVPMLLDPFDDEAFRASGVPFYAVLTNLRTGKPEYRQIHSVLAEMDVLRASASLPFASTPVELNGEKYLDGGVADSIPFAAMRRMGYDRLVVILTRDKSYRKKPMNPALIRVRYGRYPEFCKRLQERAEAYNRSVDALNLLEKQGEVFVIRPDQPIGIKRIETDPDKLQAVYDLGRRDGLASLDAMNAYLNKAE